MTRGRIVRLKLRKAQRDRLRALQFIVTEAAKYVPFYRDAFLRANVKAEDLRDIEDLRRYPITKKSDLLSSGREGHLHAGVKEKALTRRSTTGTQGTPITVFSSQGESLFRKATLLDSFRRLSRLQIPLSIADVGVEQGKIGSDWVQKLRLVTVERIFRSYPIAEQVERMRRFSPALVEGRPSSLWMLATSARLQGVQLPKPRLVVSFGEVLYPHVRELLHEVFGSRVADFYNCEEVGNVAWECPHHPECMHVNPATTILEVVDENGKNAQQGQVGSVLLTNLYNRTMPFIRYDIGDRAEISEGADCSCGFTGQSIHLVEGRDEDFFCLPDGRKMSPRNAYEAVAGVLPFKELGNDLFQVMHGFQIVQELPDLISVNVIPGPSYTADIWRGVEASAQTLHPAIRTCVRVVEKLELAPGGKFKAVMSRVETSTPFEDESPLPNA